MADEPTDQQGKLPLGGAAPPADHAAEIAQLKAQIAQSGQTMEQRLAQMQSQLAQGRPPAAPTGSNPTKELNERLWEALQNNPSELLNAQQAMTYNALRQYDQQNRQQRFASDKTLARNEVKEEFPEVFSKRASDVERVISETWPNNPDAFTNPACWRLAAQSVKGAHAADFAASAADPGAPGKPSHKPMPSTKSKDDEPLNDAETFAAEEVFGIDKATYSRHKKIDKEQRDMRTALGRSILQSPLAKMTYIDKRVTIDGMRNPNYGMERPYMTFDSQRQKPRFPRGKEAA